MALQVTVPAEPNIDEKTGEVKTIILLHGLFGSITNWESTSRFFSDKYKVAAVDFNLGDPAAPYHSIDSLTDMTVETMDRNGVQRAAVFGNSLGGHVALNLAYRFPERVTALVLTGSAGLVERSFGFMPPRPGREYLLMRIREVFCDQSFATEELAEEVYQILTSVRNKLRIIRIARSSRKLNMTELLPHLNVPTLLVWGKEDTITSPETAKVFAEKIPGAELIFLDECGHAPNIEKPEELNAAAEAFLNEIGY